MEQTSGHLPPQLQFSKAVYVTTENWVQTQIKTYFSKSSVESFQPIGALPQFPFPSLLREYLP